MDTDERRAAVDIFRHFKETGQVYIIGHDIPLSISKTLFYMLEQRRKDEAKRRGIPDDQFEYEDILGVLLGLPIQQ